MPIGVMLHTCSTGLVVSVYEQACNTVEVSLMACLPNHALHSRSSEAHAAATREKTGR